MAHHTPAQSHTPEPPSNSTHPPIPPTFNSTNPPIPLTSNSTHLQFHTPSNFTHLQFRFVCNLFVTQLFGLRSFVTCLWRNVWVTFVCNLIVTQTFGLRLFVTQTNFQSFKTMIQQKFSIPTLPTNSEITQSKHDITMWNTYLRTVFLSTTLFVFGSTACMKISVL